jgi:hypothetical protein
MYITVCLLNHMQQCMFVFCGFLRDRFFIGFFKPSNESMLSVPDFAGFVSWVVVKFSHSAMQVY